MSSGEKYLEEESIHNQEVFKKGKAYNRNVSQKEKPHKKEVSVRGLDPQTLKQICLQG